MYGGRGKGLRGGYFTTTGLTKVGFRFHQLRFVNDVAVSGRMKWNRKTGEVVARVRMSGSGRGRLTLLWNEYDANPQARVAGRIDGDSVRLQIPAP